jgi:hypothetical protein
VLNAPDDGALLLGLLSFPSAADAEAFIAQTDLQLGSCPNGFTYQLVEGPGEDQADVFVDPFGDNEVVWNIVETYLAGTVSLAEPDEAIIHEFINDWTTTAEGIDYRYVERSWDIYERYGSIVLVGSLGGYSEIAGFGDFSSPIYVPTQDALLSAMDLYRPNIVAELRAGGFID